MEETMGKLALAALMINSDIVAAARVHGEDLWAKARAGIFMVILGPEQLISKGFRDLLTHEAFYHRVCALGVDEIHLLVHWGLTFRKAFLQIGFMRSRFRSGIPIIGLTATLLADLKVGNAIFSLLGTRALAQRVNGYLPFASRQFRQIQPSTHALSRKRTRAAYYLRKSRAADHWLIMASSCGVTL
ncbi:hypothetical protein C8R46DRAFT_671790 [Mycena filopes]|nr:hypothetical protein C8R46DRAFT_671790 [Mycena filopes]